ncbi:hypothetical protein MTR_2g089295 [Medicago truncatula]|uniref:Uncharacterized protein n=1 Tax=Medicago truncatula TaxID=3880 RepID=A0A072VAG0_MEDTR|nr:hypothetical protein MTR_2g089295 [Medicago truncatula]
MEVKTRVCYSEFEAWEEPLFLVTPVFKMLSTENSTSQVNFTMPSGKSYQVRWVDEIAIIFYIQTSGRGKKKICRKKPLKNVKLKVRKAKASLRERRDLELLYHWNLMDLECLYKEASNGLDYLLCNVK